MSLRRRIIVALLLAFAGLLYYVYGGSAVPPGQPPLARLNSENFGDFRTAFNSAKDSTRIVALLSPT